MKALKHAFTLLSSIAGLHASVAVANPFEWTIEGQLDRYGTTSFPAVNFSMTLFVDLENPNASIDPVPSNIYGAVGERDFWDVVTGATFAIGDWGLSYQYSGTQYSDGSADYSDIFLTNDDWDRFHLRTGARNGEWAQTEGAATVGLSTVTVDIYDYAAFGDGDDPTATMFDGWAFPVDGSFLNYADTSIVTVGFENGVIFYGTVNDIRMANLAPVPEPETYALMLAGLGMVSMARRRRRQN